MFVYVYVIRETGRDKESQCSKHSKERETAVETQYSPCCHAAAIEQTQVTFGWSLKEMQLIVRSYMRKANTVATQSAMEEISEF